MFNTIVVAVATLCATATAASIPLVWLDGGGSHQQQQQQQRRAGTYKFSKKQNVVQQCTPDDFAGDYKYMNCQDVETKVGITCDKDNGTTKPCDYTEAPLQNDTGDEDECVIHGSFDATDIMMDPARPGVCQLKFVALKDSCKAEALPVGFGIKAEVDMTAGPDDASTMLLWFSTNEGVVYYNEDEPQETAFLHHDLPKGRKLWTAEDLCEKSETGLDDTCDPGFPNDCVNENCAIDEYKDGCAACMCYKAGNGSWCDGTKGDYYDKYFKANGKNPWGDKREENRKCNTDFQGYFQPCSWNWQCETGLCHNSLVGYNVVFGCGGRWCPEKKYNAC